MWLTCVVMQLSASTCQQLANVRRTNRPPTVERSANAGSAYSLVQERRFSRFNNFSAINLLLINAKTFYFALNNFCQQSEANKQQKTITNIHTYTPTAVCKCVCKKCWQPTNDQFAQRFRPTRARSHLTKLASSSCFFCFFQLCCLLLACFLLQLPLFSCVSFIFFMFIFCALHIYAC